MSSQLSILISLLEDEKGRLLKLIDECVAEHEYLMAHHHFQALCEVSGKLRTFNNISDKLHDEKTSKRWKIESIRKQLETQSTQHMKDHFEKSLEITTQELENLNKIPTHETSASHILDEALVDLVEKRVKKLLLFLKKSDQLLLSFNYSKKSLKVTLPYLKRHTREHVLFESEIESLKNLGFSLAGNETRLVLTLIGNKTEVLAEVRIILCKIVFEIFNFKQFANESYLQFQARKS